MMNLKRLLKTVFNKTGVSAVEFALISPVLVIMYFGVIETTQMMTADRRVSHTASVVGDLVAQDFNVNTAEVEEIFDASLLMFVPFDGSLAKLRVSSVGMKDGELEVLWSQPRDMVPAQIEDLDIPEALIDDGETLIVSEVRFKYDSALGYFYPHANWLSETFYLRPRVSNEVTHDDL